MKKILLILILLTFFSCSQDDSSKKTDKDFLIGTWTIKKTMTYHYINGELESVQEFISKQPYSTLSFESNRAVVYSNQDFTDPIYGEWILNEKILNTDLKMEVSSSTGFRTFYFFPATTIILINETELILKSPMRMETINSNGDKTESYSETYLAK